MTRLRYIVDRGVGPKGGRRDMPSTFRSAIGARSSAAERTGRFRGDPPRRRGRVLAVDLDELIDIDAGVDEQFEYHDRMLQFHAGELERLRPGNGVTLDAAWLTSNDRAQLREAAQRWIAWFERALAEPASRAAPEYGMFYLLKDLISEGKL